MSLPESFLEQYDEPFGFLDFAAIGAMSIPARVRLAEMAQAMSGREGKLIPLVMEQVESAAVLAADLIGTTPDRVAIVPNTSVGLFSVAFGLPPGSVVVPETEFAANLYPWVRAGDEGRIQPKMIEVPGGRLTADLIAGSVDASTVAVSVSYVDFHTGYRCDLASIREAVGEALLVVDAVQGLGAMAFSMRHADVMVAGGHKWLRAGGGVGVMAVSDRALERLSPTLVGWPGVKDPFDSRTPLPHPPLDNSRRFTMGSPPFTSVAALRGSLEALPTARIEDVEAAVITRSKAVEEEARRADAHVVSPWEHDSERSGIVSVRPSGEPAADTYRRLSQAGFALTERDGFLRVAPHATTHADAPAALGEVLRNRKAAIR